MVFPPTAHHIDRKYGKLIALVLVAVMMLASGCATTSTGGNNGDPYESTNRSIFKFNDALDHAVMKPVAKGYVKVTPKRVRSCVSNFFDNLGYLNTVLNDFFQGKFKQGSADLGRFVVNSTVGVLGLFDVASKVGLPPHDEDLGQTLGVYGAHQGAYLVFPLLGPNTVRDAPGLAMSTVTNGLFYISKLTIALPLMALSLIDKRARAAASLKIVNESALDRYIFIRDAYLQHREFLIYDGNPPLQYDDEDLDATDPQ